MEYFNITLGEKMNIKALQEQVKLFYKLAVYGDRASFLNSMAQATLSGPPMPIPGSPGTPGARPLSMREFLSGKVDQPDVAVPTVNVEDLPKVEAPTLPQIDPATQDHLNQLLVPSGAIVPLKLDGKFGPETAKAVKLFKEKFNKPATPANIKQEYLAVKNPEIETNFPV